MKIISIIGNGYHTKKNLVPSIGSSNNLTLNKIYSNKEEDYGTNYFSYIKDSVEKDKADLFIISTPPTSHLKILRHLTEVKKPIVIEKPLSISLEQVKEIIKISRINSMKIFEGLMFLYHPYISELNKIIENEKAIEINSKFIIPLPNSDNFRVGINKGSGSLLDTGIYILSIMQRFNLSNILEYKNSSSGKLDVGGTIKATNNDIIFSGEWGFGDYENYLEVNTFNNTYKFNYFYSKPIGYEHSIEKFSNGLLVNKIDFSNENHFLNMYDQILNNCDDVNYTENTYDLTLSRWRYVDIVQSKYKKSEV